MRRQPGERAPNDTSVTVLYGTPAGRLLLEALLLLRVPKLLGFLLRTRLSRFYVGRFIRAHGVDMADFGGDAGGRQFKSFNDFFTRKKPAGALAFDAERSHLISPSDSLLSAHKITDGATFRVTGGSEDSGPPAAATFQFEQALAQRWALD